MPGTHGSNPGGTKKKKRDGALEAGSHTERQGSKGEDTAGTSSKQPEGGKDRRGTRADADRSKGGGLFKSILNQVSSLKGSHDAQAEKDQTTEGKATGSEKRSEQPVAERDGLPNPSKVRKPKVDFVTDGSTAARERAQDSYPPPESQSARGHKRIPETQKNTGGNKPPSAPERGTEDEPETSTNFPRIVIDEVPTREVSPAQDNTRRKATEGGGLMVPKRQEGQRSRRKRVAKEGSRMESVAESHTDRSAKPATRADRGRTTQSRPKMGTVRDAGIQAEIPTSTLQTPSSDYNTNHDHVHTFVDTAAATYGSNTQYNSTNSQTFSGEYVEARCAICRFPIYVDPKTGERVDLADPPQEFCPVCGQVWPLGKPFSDEMEELIKRRLENSPIKDVLCKRCASTVNAGGEVNDRGVQVDERELKDNASWRDDHYCIPLDFERNKDSEAQSFPSDPRWRGGTKRALLIGINYSGQKGELKGCRNDVKNMYNYLKSNGYEDENIDILMDIKPHKSPTKQNILKYLEKLVRKAQPGDYLFLHYSGHGGQTKDWEGDELDGKDECIYPVDFRRIQKGMIVDDEMHRILVKIPKGSQLTALFDSCHSGSVLDLPYALENDHMKRVDLHKQYTAEEDEMLKNCGTIFLWSGCQDKQTSADTKIRGTAVGAMSAAFIKANWDLLKEKNGDQIPPSTMKSSKFTQSTTAIRDYTYDELLDRIRLILSERSQVAQLSSTLDFKPTRKKVYV